MIARAVVAHASPGRVRLRIAERRHDTAWFDAVAAACTALPAVRHCETNALTASLLLEYAGPLTAVRDALAAVVAFDEDAASAPMASPGAALPALGRRLRDAEAAALSAFDSHADTVRAALSATLLVLGGVQLLRGRVLAPAASLFWYALNALPRRAAMVHPAAPAADAPAPPVPSPPPPVVHGHG